MFVNNTSLYTKVMSKWNEMKTRSSDIKYFTSSLEKMSNTKVGIFGGAVRDWWLDKTPKDIDLVIDASEASLKSLLDNFGAQKNGFGGNVIVIDGVTFDFWTINDTYAFRTGQMPSSWVNLAKSVPFNTDAVVVMLDGSVIEQGFWEAIDKKKIEFLNRIIRDPQRIARRAIAQSDKYQFELSEELKTYVKEHIFEEEFPLFDDLIDDVKINSGSSNKDC